jgi:nicotinamidase-related amidase
MGARRALLIVDAIDAFTDPARPLGSAVDAEIAVIRRLLERLRAHGLPVYFTTQAYSNPQQSGVWREKLPSLAELRAGSHWLDAKYADQVTADTAVQMVDTRFAEAS